MILSEVVELITYWRSNPPLHLLVAGMLGIEKPAEYDTVKKMTDEDIKQFAESFNRMNQ